MKAVFLDTGSLDCDDLQLDGLSSTASQWCFYPSTSRDQIAPRIADADIVVVNKVVLDAPVLQQASKLKLICLAATGTNNVDLLTAREQGIQVSNCQAYGTASVAQHVLGLMLALSTRLLQYQQAVREGLWASSSRFCLLDFPIVELENKILGIVGYGELGKRVADLGKAFGMQVVVAERPGVTPRSGRVTLHDLLPQIDFLSLHCPLTPQTQNLIAAQELALMKPAAMLINASRGGIVDEQALVDALNHGRLAGAGIDVLTEEPPVNGNILLQCQHPNLIITPHSAWGSREARQRIVNQLQETIQDFIAGRATRVVN
ncbi:MAG: 2-hydroxyacid dehydrogenase [Motiliproteus sp.]